MLHHLSAQLQHVGSGSLTRDWTRAPCTGSSESKPLEPGEVPQTLFLKIMSSSVFSVALSLRYFARAFSSCGEQGPPLFAAQRLLLRSSGSRLAGFRSCDARAE